MKSTIKKAFTIAVSLMTAVGSMGVAAFAPLSVAAAPSAAAYTATTGDLVKASLASVYYIGADGKRYVFTTQGAFESWFADFSSVQTITDTELASIAIGGNVTYQAGSKMLKITTDPKTYLASPNASLRWVDSEAAAVALYGASWAQNIHDVADAFFTNYTVSGDQVSAALALGGSSEGLWYNDGTNWYVLTGGTWSQWSGTANPNLSSVTAATFSAYPLGSAISTLPWSPDGGATAPPSTTSDFTFSLTSAAAGTMMSSYAAGPPPTGSNNVLVAKGSLCGTGTLEGLRLSAKTGTVTFSTTLVWAQIGDSTYEVAGTLESDTIVDLTATDTNASLSGCKDLMIYASTTSVGGFLNIDLDSITTNSSAAAVATLAVNKRVVTGNVVPVATADLADFAFTNPLPAGGPTLQTDGTMQKVFGVSLAVSNNDILLPNFVYKLSGSVQLSKCEHRENGVLVSTDYTNTGKYWSFAIPADKQVKLQSTYTEELWCNVDGEAGQTVTPSVQWPAPGFHFYDNNRSGNVEVASGGVRMTSAVPAALNLAGASASLVSIPLANVTDVNVDKTSGATNKVMAAYQAKVRGSRATLSNLVYTAAAAQSAKGFTLCQVEIGMRTDKANFDTAAVNPADFSMSNFGSEKNVTSAANVTVTANKKMEVGDHLVLFICDAVTAGAAYANNDAVAISVQTGTTNISFDVTGTTAAFPLGTRTGGTNNIKLLTAMSATPSGSVVYNVQNGSNFGMGTYQINGVHEAVSVTSIVITLAAAFVVTPECTQMTLKNAAGTEITTSQSIVSTATVYTFSVNLTVPQNGVYTFEPTCLQASSAVTPAVIANGTTLTSFSGTGLDSSQSFTASTGWAGPTITVVASGTVDVTDGSNGPNQMIGPGVRVLLQSVNVAASIHEDQSFTQGILDLLPGAGVSLPSELSAIELEFGGGFVVDSSVTTPISRIPQGVSTYTIAHGTITGTAYVVGETITGTAGGTGVVTAISANQTTYTVTAGALVSGDTLTGGTGGGTSVASSAPVLATGNIFDVTEGLVVIPAGQTGVLNYYGYGNSVGSIGLDATPVDGTLAPSFDRSLNVTMKGSMSQSTITDAADTADTTGTIVYPAGVSIQVVNTSQVTAYTLPPNAEALVLDFTVGGATFTLTNFGGDCTTNSTANNCITGTDTVSLTVDGVVKAPPQALSGVTWDFTGLSQALSGTSTLMVSYTDTLDANTCAVNNKVSLTQNDTQGTNPGVPGVTQVWGAGETGLMPGYVGLSGGAHVGTTFQC